MERVSRGPASFWRCACGAHGIGVAALRKLLPRDLWHDVWPGLRAAATRGARACPACARPMDESSGLVAFGGVRLDICDPCQFVWIDPDEFAALPKAALPPELPLEVRQAAGKALAEAMQLEYDARETRLFGPFQQYGAAIFAALLTGFLSRR
jgi:Zn-finger nucleic acid-binding protein